MFDSNIKADKFIEDLQLEIDVALDIPKETYMEWLNSLEQMLYSEIIKEQKSIVLKVPDGGVVDLKDIGFRFEDIHAVFSGDTQLIKTTLTSGAIFPQCYFKKDNNLSVNLDGDEIKIIYFVRPEIKVIDDNEVVSGNVMLPVEFIDLAKTKLRGEAYKLANEDALAAKWLNDYNVLLETFKAWISGKAPEFGL